jgi:hypothetical protein
VGDKRYASVRRGRGEANARRIPRLQGPYSTHLKDLVLIAELGWSYEMMLGDLFLEAYCKFKLPMGKLSKPVPSARVASFGRAH